jgi:methyltransferase family protein
VSRPQRLTPTPPPALSWPTRLKAIRKLATRRDGYLLIKWSSDDVVQPRDEDYVMAPVPQILERAKPGIDRLATALGPGMELGPHVLGALANNDRFAGCDAFAAYAMPQHYRPRRLIEIGGGHSTLIFRQAARDGGLDFHITYIDPEPTRSVDGAADVVIRQPVQQSGIDIGDELAAGDLLFIDGSHHAFNGTDVLLFLEILPKLNAGVLVHVHDIMLPYEYPSLFTARGYNEQYVLAALLLGGSYWQPLLPIYWLSRHGRLPPGSSFWMERSGDGSG